jgi:glycosyltransferase involved in cell wall biosynthesis
MESTDVCVLHIAGDASAESLQGIIHALAQLGLHQVLLPLRGRFPARSLEQVEVRMVQWPGTPLARLRALEEELAALAAARSFYAVHLHGALSCLLGSRALRAGTVAARLPRSTRLLFSPRLAHLGSWRAALMGRMLKAELAPLHGGVLLASPGEAHILSRLLERSAEVLPPLVDSVYLHSSRAESARPAILAGGSGSEAIDGVSRLAVLLNGREERVGIAWLGPVARSERAQLQAAGVQVFDAEDDAASARLLSTATAYLHISQTAGRLRALAQAMATGVPCLASDTLAHRALVRHGETGFICAGDLDFVERLILLLRDAGERERVGQAARAEAARLFTLRHFEAAVLRAYGFHRVTLLPKKSIHVA